MPVAALSVEDVSVSFAGIQALADVTVTAEERERLGLIGPNGAGKTTLLNVISGFQRPDSGEVKLFDRAITKMSVTARGKHGLARTFQGLRLFGRLTVQENLEVSALNHGRSRRAARALARDAIGVIGLFDLADTPAGVLPHGDQRRVALARCLAMDPKVILMDEPAAGLDERETTALGDAVERIRQEHQVTVVLIEHDVALVMRLSDRIFVLAEGRPLALGTPAEIRENPAVVAAYLGEADAGG